MAAKNKSWSDFIDSLGAPKNSTKFWNFTKSMVSGVQEPSLCKFPLIHNAVTINSYEDKANLLLDQFCPVEHPQLEEHAFDTQIVESLYDNSPHPVNSEFTTIEINNCLQDLKSKAMGPDLIHNRMLKNLNNTNHMALTHLINTLFISGFVPEVWKSATVIPLLKPGKDPSKTDSYRPISLTSCLAKIMAKRSTID